MKEQDILLAEMIVKITAIERLLVRSKIIDAEELITEMKKISDDILGVIMSKKQ